MGYLRKQTIYKLVFDDEEYRGLEVYVRRAPLDVTLRLAHLVSLEDVGRQIASGNIGDPETVTKATETLDELFRLFSEVLYDWNLENEDADGKPVSVPATYDGLKRQDPEFVLDVISAWRNGIDGPAAASGKQPATRGQRPARAANADADAEGPDASVEAALPMAALSG